MKSDELPTCHGLYEEGYFYHECGYLGRYVVECAERRSYPLCSGHAKRLVIRWEKDTGQSANLRPTRVADVRSTFVE